MNDRDFQPALGARRLPAPITLALLTFSSCVCCASHSTGADNVQPSNDMAMLRPWTGPYGGVPPWQLVRPDGFVAAFDAAIEQAGKEIDAIAADPRPPSFENTLVALEKAGRPLDRLEALFGVHAENLNVGPMPDIEKTVMPKLAAFHDRVTQNEKLFARIDAIHESAEAESLTRAEKRLLEDQYKDFVRRGARLSTGDKAKLSSINQRLASLFTQFTQNVLADEQGYVTWIENKTDLAGLPDSVVAAMAAAAKKRGKQGQWAVTNTRSSMDPFLTYADNRALRETVWRNYYRRGDNGDRHDNKAIISEILHLRAERASLLGYPTHAHWRIERTMAKTPEAAMDLMMWVWPKAVARARQEVAAMQAIADAEGRGATIEAWDYRYYAEKVRKAKYDLDFNEVKPYLQLEKLVEAMMWVAGQLYGLQFKPVSDVPRFHPDVRVFEVVDTEGRHVGLWYLDPYAREGKRSGAWMTAYRVQENIDRPITPIVSNNSNFVPSAEGAPVLISWDDAVTLFTNSAMPCTDCSRRSSTGRRRALRSSATTWSSRRNCSNTGCRHRRCSTVLPFTTRPVSRCRPNWWPRSSARKRSTRDSRRSNTWPPRWST